MALEILAQFAPGAPKINHVMACERDPSKQDVLPWTQQLVAIIAYAISGLVQCATLSLHVVS
jgi:hypothetical protein